MPDDPLTSTPNSPPAPPVIPKGLATWFGLIGTGLLGLAAALVPFLPNAGADTSKAFVALATLVMVATILGRMLQSAAALIGGTAGTAPATSAPTSITYPLEPLPIMGGRVEYQTQPERIIFPNPSEDRDEQALEDAAAEELAPVAYDDPSAIPPDTGNPEVGHEDAPPAAVTPDGPNAVRAEG